VRPGERIHPDDLPPSYIDKVVLDIVMFGFATQLKGTRHEREGVSCFYVRTQLQLRYRDMSDISHKVDDAFSRLINEGKLIRSQGLGGQNVAPVIKLKRRWGLDVAP
jgi:hypothetical protein